MSKKLKKIISMAMTAIMMFGISTSVFAEGVTSDFVSKSNDVQVEQIGAWQEHVKYGDVSILDTTTETNRNITTSIGTDDSVYNEDLTSGIATLSVNGQIIETYDMNAIRENITTWTMPESDSLLLEEHFRTAMSQDQSVLTSLPNDLKDEYTVSKTGNGIVVTPIMKTRAYGTTIRPYQNVTSAYPPYTYKTVKTQSTFSSVCNRNLSLTIKDSMYSYSLKSKSSSLFNAGTAVSVISGALKLASGTVLNSLIGFTSVVAGVLRLSTNVDYYFSEDYNFYAIRQGCVYDYTTNYRDVSVDTQSGQGRLSMTWDFINSAYRNPAWKVTAQAYPHTISFDTMFSEAKRIWEFNMEEYGYWKWGDV